MTAFWFCYGLYIAPNPEGTRICLIGTHEEGPTVVRFQQVFDDVHFREFTVFFRSEDVRAKVGRLRKHCVLKSDWFSVILTCRKNR